MYDHDDWYDDDETGWIKEEPDCGACGDSGQVPARLFGRYRSRRCRWCRRPTWLGLMVGQVSYAYRSLRRRRRGAVHSDEAPF